MTVPPSSYTSEPHASLLCEDNTHRYATWYTIGSPRQLMVGKQALAGGAWTTFQITGAARTALGYPFTNDEHNYPSIAVDGNGRLHLWANMHNNPLRYVRSTNPGDITVWAAASLTGSDIECSYPNPIQHPNGSVRITLRSGPVGTGSGNGNTYFWDMGPTASTFGSSTMIFRGVSVPNAKGPGIPGDGYGVNTIYNWSCYHGVACQDVGGGNFIEHYFFVWREIAVGGPDPERTNVKPGYMQYRSATNTWHSILGDQVTLPVDPINFPTLLTGTTHGGEGFVNTQSVTYSPDGTPHAILSKLPYYYVTWNGSAWQQTAYGNTSILNLHSWTLLGNIHPIWLRGKLWFLATGFDEGYRRPVLVRADGTAHVVMGGDLPGSETWHPSYSWHAWAKRGVVDVLTPRGDTPKVLSFGRAHRVTAA